MKNFTFSSLQGNSYILGVVSFSVMIGLCSALFTPKAANGQTFTTTDPPTTSTTAPNNTQTINVPVGTGVITDVNTSFYLVDTGLSFTDELGFTLTSPSATTVRLWGPGFAGTSIPYSGGYAFDDEAALVLSGAPGTWQLGNSDGSLLSDFDGELADGVWTLTLTEAWASSASFNSFALMFVAIAPGSRVPTPAVSSSRTSSDQPIILTDLGAIYSTMSGLQMAGMNRNVTHLASRGATRDLNERIFRARAGLTTNGRPVNGVNGNLINENGVVDSTNSTSNDLRYLHFAATQLIDYRVALGLADGQQVELVETLSAGETAWARQPFGMLGAPIHFTSVIPLTIKAVIPASEGSEKNPTIGKEVVEYDPPSRFEVYSAFDYGYYDQDNLTRNARGFEVDSYAGSLGAEFRALDWLMVGAAFTHTWSDSEATANLGNVDLEGQLLSAYFTAVLGQTWFDALYSYGDFDNEINRNTLIGGRARGDTNSFSHNISLNAGHNIHLTDRIVATPYTGLDYSTGNIDGYVEQGGGLANLIYPDDSFESMIGRLGASLTYTTNIPLGKVTIQGRGGWAHEFEPEGDTVSATLQTSPFALLTGNSLRRVGTFTATETSPHAGQDWMELGAGVRLDIGNTGFNVQLDYEGQFSRNNASAHFGSAKVGYEW